MIGLLFRDSSILSYIVAWLLLGLVIWLQAKGTDPTIFPLNNPNAVIAFFLLSLCMIACDWIVKQEYWAKKGNYHLVVFPITFLSLPSLVWDNWKVLFILFFMIGYIVLLRMLRSGQELQKVFNGSFWVALGCLFFPEGLILFPFVWVLIALYNKLSFQTFFISVLPFGLIYLLEITLHFFSPQYSMISIPNIKLLVGAFNWEFQFDHYIWLITCLVLVVFSFFRHNIDLNRKGVNYRSSVFTLYAIVIFALLLGFASQEKASLTWVLFLMSVSIISTRFFEEIKQGWLKEFFCYLFFATVLFNKIKEGFL